MRGVVAKSPPPNKGLHLTAHRASLRSARCHAGEAQAAGRADLRSVAPRLPVIVASAHHDETSHSELAHLASEPEHHVGRGAFHGPVRRPLDCPIRWIVLRAGRGCPRHPGTSTRATFPHGPISFERWRRADSLLRRSSFVATFLGFFGQRTFSSDEAARRPHRVA